MIMGITIMWSIRCLASRPLTNVTTEAKRFVKGVAPKLRRSDGRNTPAPKEPVIDEAHPGHPTAATGLDGHHRSREHWAQRASWSDATLDGMVLGPHDPINPKPRTLNPMQTLALDPARLQCP